ncbi:thiamine ABC transporter substrate-binding protein [Desulforhopalus singaporensis]|uniref:Thiamine transport system substrate-binding protein n=1 Tax=Desulforhopalus singaporensis TaxID=91360 RepID=A0A1H0J5Q8_9BACT|nr:thiamine ABC transporter substrate-binding protein [Desulforhopalus singaporensis]SDO39075.1 thiamine transport system substrate-binding protein [Desulforhopalus singaporensis]
MTALFRSVPVLVILFALCVQPAAAEKSLTLMTHDSFNVSKEVLAGFEKEHGVKVRILKAGDAGAALIQAILSRENPMADLFFGVDNTFFSRAIKGDIFRPYNSPLLAKIPAELQLDKQHRLLPVDYGDVCLNYDKQWFRQHDLLPPSSLDDLVLPAYRGLTVVQNPATSSPGMAFLLATVGKYGEDDFIAYWKKLRNNDVLVTGGWEDAYFGHFTAASKGDRPIVVSYASSPPAAVYYAEKELAEAPTAAVVTAGSAFRQIEFAGILKNTQNGPLAEKFIDFMLSRSFQEDIPLKMFVFPSNSEATLPEVFVKHAKVAEDPATVSPDAIEMNREKWIEAWTEAVLR